MSAALVRTSATLQRQLQSIPPVGWNDPRPAEIGRYLQTLEAVCLETPRSVESRTCHGIACAVNDDVYAAIDALENGGGLDPTPFWAQLRFAELQYQRRALALAEEETLTALELAQNAWQMWLARRQLQEIRRFCRESRANTAWATPIAMAR